MGGQRGTFLGPYTPRCRSVMPPDRVCSHASLQSKITWRSSKLIKTEKLILVFVWMHVTRQTLDTLRF